MPKLTVLLGVCLTLTGVITHVATGMGSVTALIPAFVGVPILVLGVVAHRPGPRRHAIHAALVLALLGLLGSLMNVARVGELISGRAERPGAIIESMIMFLLCLGYLIIGVRSFIAARRARRTASAHPVR